MTTPARAEHHLLLPAAVDGLRLDQALAQLLGQYSRSQLKHWIESGDATLNGAVVKPRTRVHAGDAVRIAATLAASAALAPQAVAFTVVYEDAGLAVVHKPAGVVVHPGAGNPDATLVNGLLARYPETAALPRAGLIHRIDKDTSGLLLVARSSAVYQALVRAMAARAISREYLAVVNGVVVAGGTIDAAIARDPLARTRMRVLPGGRSAVTHYRVRERYRAHSLLDVTLETGRTHQIRVHFAWRGHPLVGDSRYGSRPRPPAGADPALLAVLGGFRRQALHAAQLGFTHPVSGTALAFSAPPPADFTDLLAALAADRAAHTVLQA